MSLATALVLLGSPAQFYKQGFQNKELGGERSSFLLLAGRHSSPQWERQVPLLSADRERTKAPVALEMGPVGPESLRSHMWGYSE